VYEDYLADLSVDGRIILKQIVK